MIYKIAAYLCIFALLVIGVAFSALIIHTIDDFLHKRWKE